MGKGRRKVKDRKKQDTAKKFEQTSTKPTILQQETQALILSITTRAHSSLVTAVG